MDIEPPQRSGFPLQETTNPHATSVSDPFGYQSAPSRPAISAASPYGPFTTDLTARPGPSSSRPAGLQSPRPTPPNIKAARSSVEDGLRELMSLQRDRYRTEKVDAEARLRLQSAGVSDDLRALREEVAHLIREAESHRWRKWMLGGFIYADDLAMWQGFRDSRDSSPVAPTARRP